MNRRVEVSRRLRPAGFGVDQLFDISYFFILLYSVTRLIPNSRAVLVRLKLFLHNVCSIWKRHFSTFVEVDPLRNYYQPWEWQRVALLLLCVR